MSSSSYPPHVQAEQSTAQRFFQQVARLALLALVLMPAFHYGNLPEQIPQNFNAAGEFRGMGSKAWIWLLPAIGVVVFLGANWLTKWPHKHNYPVHLTEENAPRIYGISNSLLWFVAAVLLTLSAFITHVYIQAALGLADGAGATGVILLFLVVLFVGIFYFIGKMFKAQGKAT